MPRAVSEGGASSNRPGQSQREGPILTCPGQSQREGPLLRGPGQSQRKRPILRGSGQPHREGSTRTDPKQFPVCPEERQGMVVQGSSFSYADGDKYIKYQIQAG